MQAELCHPTTGAGVVGELERRFAALVGARFCVAMNNCTSAVHAALLAHGVGRRDEVIVPAYTWGGSLTGLLHLGAVPVFADVDDTLTLDPEDVERKVNGRVKAVVAAHLYGHPCDVRRLKEVCRRHRLALIEDCAHAFQATADGRAVGTFGTGCFSLPHGAGAGGMLSTDDEKVFDRALYYTQSPLRQRSEMLAPREPNEFTLDYGLDPLAAASILSGLEAATEALRRRRAFFELLNEEVGRSPFEKLSPVTVRPNVVHSWHRYSPALTWHVSERELGAIRDFFFARGCRVEQGYVPRPLYCHRALAALSRLSAKRARATILARTEQACVTRIGVRPLAPDWR
jgi:dTDP-4-amino-4,6-dideoxygalactose transaminase